MRGVHAAGCAGPHAVPQGAPADLPPHKLLPARCAVVGGRKKGNKETKKTPWTWVEGPAGYEAQGGTSQPLCCGEGVGSGGSMHCCRPLHRAKHAIVACDMPAWASWPWAGPAPDDQGQLSTRPAAGLSSANWTVRTYNRVSLLSMVMPMEAAMSVCPPWGNAMGEALVEGTC